MVWSFRFVEYAREYVNIKLNLLYGVVFSIVLFMILLLELVKWELLNFVVDMSHKLHK